MISGEIPDSTPKAAALTSRTSEKDENQVRSDDFGVN
jgi:hypothetical protein